MLGILSEGGNMIDSTLEENLLELEKLENERWQTLPEYIQKSITRNKKIKKWSGRIAKTMAALGLAASIHVLNPTWPQNVKAFVTDKSTETQVERKVEREFGINYYGNKNEKTLMELEQTLNYIKEQNPIFLKYLKNVIIHKSEDLDTWYTRPFRFFGGRAYPNATIELCHGCRGTKHESTHIVHFNLSEEFNEKIRRIHPENLWKYLDWSPVKKFDMPDTWKDGKQDPRHGQVCPYGALSIYEIVATYVDKVDDLRFWENPVVRKDPIYLQTLEVLAEYGLVTHKEFQDIKDTINLYNPAYVSDLLMQEINLITSPKHLNSYHAEVFSEETYYDSDKLKLSYMDGRHFSSLRATIKTDSGRNICFELKKDAGKLSVSQSLKDTNEFFPQQALDRLQELGYDKLFNWEERERLKGEK